MTSVADLSLVTQVCGKNSNQKLMDRFLDGKVTWSLRHRIRCGSKHMVHRCTTFISHWIGSIAKIMNS